MWKWEKIQKVLWEEFLGRCDLIMKWEVYHEYDEEDIRVQSVIIEVENDEIKLYEAWEKYLKDKINLSFKGKVIEYQHPSSRIQQGDEVTVVKFESIEDLYGIIVEVRFGRKKIYFPLCDLEAIELNEEGKQPLDDYRYWFANR